MIHDTSSMWNLKQPDSGEWKDGSLGDGHWVLHATDTLLDTTSETNDARIGSWLIELK